MSQLNIYHCTRCMKKFAEERIGSFLCPYCNCAVLRLGGPPPLNPPKRSLLLLGQPIPPAPRLIYQMIPLTRNNVESWKKYVYAMRLIANNEDQYSRDMKYGWSQAVKGFTDALDAFRKTTDPRAWIAVVSHGPISMINDPIDAAVRIEMCMTVTTAENVPFSTHMGIFRSPLRKLSMTTILKLSLQKMFDVGKIVMHLEEYGSNLRSAPRISGQIHAFAAMHVNKVSKFNDRKIYMITAPLKKMMEIIEGNFIGNTTREIRVEEINGKCVLHVGSVPLNLENSIWRNNPWVEEITDLRGGRPKIAVDLAVMERALNERIRGDSILDWLDKQY